MQTFVLRAMDAKGEIYNANVKHLKGKKKHFIIMLDYETRLQEKE